MVEQLFAGPSWNALIEKTVFVLAERGSVVYDWRDFTTKPAKLCEALAKDISLEMQRTVTAYQADEFVIVSLDSWPENEMEQAAVDFVRRETQELLAGLGRRPMPKLPPMPKSPGRSKSKES